MELERTQGDMGDYAQRKRAEKRRSTEAVGIDTAFIDHLVERFYYRIRGDEVLGSIFTDRIADWPAHLARMKSFWRSVLHNTGEFSGNPMLKHMTIPGLGLAHFSRWLDLFYQTLREIEPNDSATQLVGERARMIADSLLTGIVMRRDGLKGSRAGLNLPYV